MEFQSYREEAVFLDPGDSFLPRKSIAEIRLDPLTGKRARVLPFTGHQPVLPDLGELARRTAGECPFCSHKLEDATPRFPDSLIPGGRICHGETTLFPNLYPYDRWSAVVVLGNQHYVPLPDIKADLLADGFRAAQSYLRPLVTAGEISFFSVNWNYMLLAGASMIHPHLQVIAGRQPTNLQGEILHRSAAYLEQNGVDFWSDLVTSEARLEERYLGEGQGIHWLVAFAPRGFSEVLGLVAEKPCFLEMDQEQLLALAGGVVKVLAYYHSMNYYNFNLALFSGRSKDVGFWTQVRMVPRLPFSRLGTSDINYFGMLHDEWFTLLPPEEAAARLKPFFSGW